MLKIIFPGVTILSEAGNTTINPNIKTSRNIFLNTSKIFNLAKRYNEKINNVIVICALRWLAILIIKTK
jgi:hypothetical protein